MLPFACFIQFVWDVFVRSPDADADNVYVCVLLAITLSVSQLCSVCSSCCPQHPSLLYVGHSFFDGRMSNMAALVSMSTITCYQHSIVSGGAVHVSKDRSVGRHSGRVRWEL